MPSRVGSKQAATFMLTCAPLNMMTFCRYKAHLSLAGTTVTVRGDLRAFQPQHPTAAAKTSSGPHTAASEFTPHYFDYHSKVGVDRRTQAAAPLVLYPQTL